MQACQSRYLIESHESKLNYKVVSHSKEESYRNILSNFINILVPRRGFGVSDLRDTIFAHTRLVPKKLDIGNVNYL